MNEVSTSSEEYQKQLIRAVSKNSVLYNPKHRSFKNITSKNEAWKKIAAELGSDEKKCKNDWISLRYNYQKHFRVLTPAFKIRRNIKLKKVLRKTMPELLFLRPFVTKVSQNFKPRKELITSQWLKASEKNNNVVDSANEVIDLDQIIEAHGISATTNGESNKNRTLIDKITEIIDVDLLDDTIDSASFTITPQIRLLIDLVRCYPELYNVKHRFFKDSVRKGTIWCSISNEVGDKATKLMKYWMHLETRYEWELEHSSRHVLQPYPTDTEMQKLLEFLKPHIKKKPNTIYKQSVFLKNKWSEPISNFKKINQFVKMMKSRKDIILTTEKHLNGTNNKVDYVYIQKWQNMGRETNFSAGTCEITWLILRAFYMSIWEMRQSGYLFQDKWYFENVMSDLLDNVKKNADDRTKLSEPSNNVQKLPVRSVTQTNNANNYNIANANARQPNEMLRTLILKPQSNINDKGTTLPIRVENVLNKTIIYGPEDFIPYGQQGNKNGNISVPQQQEAPVKPVNNFLPGNTTPAITTKLYAQPKPNAPLINSVSVAQPPTVIQPNPPINFVSVHSMNKVHTPIQQPPPMVYFGSKGATDPLLLNSTHAPIQSKTNNDVNTLNIRNIQTTENHPVVTVAENSVPRLQPIVNRIQTEMQTAMTNIPVRNIQPQDYNYMNGAGTIIPQLVNLNEKSAYQQPTLNVPMANPQLFPINTVEQQTLPEESASVSPPPLGLKISKVQSLLSSNEIMIELVAQSNGKQLVVHGPPLAGKTYSLGKDKVAVFIRLVMGIPQLHNKSLSSIYYWQHISSKIDLPANICKACWNFLSSNVNHFHHFGPMHQLMKPIKTDLEVWKIKFNLFDKFNETAITMGWDKHVHFLPKLIVVICQYPPLYNNSIKTSVTQNKRIWKSLCRRHPNIRELPDLWNALRDVFWRYLMQLEQGIDNKWPLLWWRTLYKLEFLVVERYSTSNPFYYIVHNKIEEEAQRCRIVEYLKCMDSAPVEKLPVSDMIFTKAVRNRPQIYKPHYSLEEKNIAWMNLANELKCPEDVCKNRFKYLFKRYRLYASCDPKTKCVIQKKYFVHLNYIHSQLKPDTSIKLRIRTPMELNHIASTMPQNTNSNSRENSISPLVMIDDESTLNKRIFKCLSELPPSLHDALEIGLMDIFKKYETHPQKNGLTST